jgi:3-deoxy-D-arabino-heptulosonate 7-phosphate (DAHP) synthase
MFTKPTKAGGEVTKEKLTVLLQAGYKAAVNEVRVGCVVTPGSTKIVLGFVENVRVRTSQTTFTLNVFEIVIVGYDVRLTVMVTSHSPISVGTLVLRVKFG